MSQKKKELELALQLLIQIFKNQTYSNLALKNQPSVSRLVTAFVYGVIERNLTLEAIIDRYSKRPCRKLDLEISLILKLGIYQLLFMDSIPDNAAVNETVKLCYTVRKVSAKGFVNGVLREFIRAGKSIGAEQEQNPQKRLSMLYSCPLWLVEKWCAEYSLEQAEEILRTSIGRPPLTIRVNTLKTSAQSLSAKLSARGIPVTENPWLTDCLHLEQTGRLGNIPEFGSGEFFVQDLASQLCAKLTGAQPGNLVYDLCAAPGAKSFSMAIEMQNIGQLHSFDLYDHKLELISQMAKRLGISIIQTHKQDAARFDSKLPPADIVLCDVPCSGLGIIRRKPEIKYKSPEQFQKLPEVQYRILENAARYVRPGGRLIYSTCTLSRMENQEVALRFLKNHPKFQPDSIPEELTKQVMTEKNCVTFLPQMMNSDGFFIALFKRVMD